MYPTKDRIVNYKMNVISLSYNKRSSWGNVYYHVIGQIEHKKKMDDTNSYEREDYQELQGRNGCL